MKLDQLYSGSSGNLYTVTATNGKRILLECGVTWDKLQKALSFDLSRFEGCLVSHQHKDHSKSLCDVMIAGVDVYATAGVFESQFVFGRRRTNVIRKDHLTTEGKPNWQKDWFSSFDVMVFRLSHDVPIVGFVIRERKTGETLLFCTDTFYVKPRFPRIPFDIVAIECSYSKEILQKLIDDGKIEEVVARRLLMSHMEKENTLHYLREFCNLDRCREIHLLHCSGLNLDKAATKAEFEQEFFIKTIIVGD